MFDAALMELAHLSAGDQVNVEVHEGGTNHPHTAASRAIAREVSQGHQGHDEGLRADDEEAGMKASPDNCFHLTRGHGAGDSRASAIARFGGSEGVRERALLESAVAAPQASFGGKSPYRDLADIAAAYLYYLCQNHPFVDGNKRDGAGRMHRVPALERNRAESRRSGTHGAGGLARPGCGIGTTCWTAFGRAAPSKRQCHRQDVLGWRRLPSRARRSWWPARVTRPVPRIKSPLHHFNACRPNWCSRQDSHLHWRRSRRRVSALDYASKEMEPPAGDAPAGFLYKRNPQAAAWRRQNGRSPRCCPGRGWLMTPA